MVVVLLSIAAGQFADEGPRLSTRVGSFVKQDWSFPLDEAQQDFIRGLAYEKMVAWHPPSAGWSGHSLHVVTRDSFDYLTNLE